MPFAPGTRVGLFEISARVDVAGLGELSRARDHEHQREVAMRVLPADFGADPDRLRRFEQEARAAALLAHENILTIYDIGTDARAAYVISEPIEARTLRAVLASGALPVRTAIQYGGQIAHALSAAHERGIVHRDLKPENILIGADGRVRVVGFGLAAVTQVESAPEQVKGVPADARSDVFTLDAILYEMLTGARAFAGDTPVAPAQTVAPAPPAAPAPPVTDADVMAPPRRRLGRIVAFLAAAALLVALIPAALRVLPTAWQGTVGAPAGAADPPIATMTMPDRPVAEFALSPTARSSAFPPTAAVSPW
jgi:serine/threonine protein kinase